MATEAVPDALLEKEAALKDLLRQYGALAIAYSGGVDSAYLCDVAHEVLEEKAQMVLADSPSIPRRELDKATELAQDRGWPLTILKTEEFANEAFLRNDAQRCYVCKAELFTKMDAFARERGVTVLAYGENAGDMLDSTRFGARAAREAHVAAPLAEAGLAKDEIRQLSKRRKLPTWDKASFACLSSRFPMGTRLEIEELRKVEGAELLLHRLGFRQYRARHHGGLCRIEVEPEDFGKVLEPALRDELVKGLRAIGYRHVTLDLAGYRSGSTAG